MSSIASGGTVTTYTASGNIYTVHTFTTVGNSTFTLNQNTTVDFLLVAGGGGGSDGGGGAGGLVYATGYSLTASSYTITVGGGGAVATAGGNTTAFSITANGGGRGGSVGSQSAATGLGGSGGSGGGGGREGTPNAGSATQGSGTGYTGFGNAGGSGPIFGGPSAAGGGGAGGVGGNGVASTNPANGGNGGAGRQYDIDGTAKFYAGGGGGSPAPSSGSLGLAGSGVGGGRDTGANAIANRGGGGGGSGTGGSGIVIIRYISATPLPTTNLDMLSIRNMFAPSKVSPHAINQFYRGGLYVGISIAPNGPIPISGQIDFGKFRAAYSGGAYIFTLHTFTSAGQTLRTGPTLAQIQSAYSSASWTQNTDYLNMTTQGIQIWTVPKTGNYNITVAGSKGGNNYNSTTTSARGVVMNLTNVPLNISDKLYIIVGQSGTRTGGGGASWVYYNSMNTLWFVAGGGGGPSTNAWNGPGSTNYFGMDGILGNNGGTGYTSGSSYAGGAGGTGGNPGLKGANLTTGYNNDGGAGVGGANSTAVNDQTPRSIGGSGGGGSLNASSSTFLGGDGYSAGGFGGGGAGGGALWNSGGGGGGGYSGGGGGGGGTDNGGGGGGGGGGSYYINYFSSWTATNTGQGYVTITSVNDVAYVIFGAYNVGYQNSYTLDYSNYGYITFDPRTTQNFVGIIGLRCYTSGNTFLNPVTAAKTTYGVILKNPNGTIWTGGLGSANKFYIEICAGTNGGLLAKIDSTSETLVASADPGSSRGEDYYYYFEQSPQSRWYYWRSLFGGGRAIQHGYNFPRPRTYGPSHPTQDDAWLWQIIGPYGTINNPGTNAADILSQRGGYLPDGIYYINCNGVSTPIYCLMDKKYDGGGWMLLMKATNGATFGFDANYWTTTNTLNPSDTTLNNADAKYDAFNHVTVKDVMAIWPVADLGITGGSLSISDGWVWLLNNWFNSGQRTTALSGFQNSRDGIPLDVFSYSGFANNTSIWSWQSGTRWHGIGGGSHFAGIASTQRARWGWFWNNEGGTLASSDAMAGIGLNAFGTQYSGGDFFFWAGVDYQRANRTLRFHLYGR